MENSLYTFETKYTFKLFTKIARAARKTVTKQSMLTMYLLSLVVGVLFLVRFFPREGIELSLSTVIIWTAFGLMIIALLLKDIIEAHYFKRATRPEEMEVKSFFGEDGYVLSCQSGDIDYKYSSVETIIEIPEGFILSLGNNKYKLLQSESIQGGTVDEFRTFIENKTGKKVQYVK